MPEVFNPLAVKIVMNGTLHGQLYQNVFYVRKADGGGWLPEQVEEATGKFALFWETELSPLVSNGLVITDVRGRVMTPVNAAQAVTFSGVSGALTDEGMPNSAAFCIRANTGFAGRSAIGRVYQGGLVNQQVTVNSVNVGTANSFVNAYNLGIISRLINTGTIPMVPVVYSRQAAGGNRPTALLTDIVSYTYTDLALDAQRRRLPGRGR